MKQRPSFQFYQQDFLASQDVQTMTAEQVGCYCLMLLNCYNNGGSISNDPEDLKVLCRGIAPASKVLKKFYAASETLRNKRVDEELEKQVKFSITQSQNAKKGWDKRIKQTMPSHSHGINSASIRHSSSSSSSSSNIPPIVPKGDGEGFERFWKTYPRKVAKPNAVKAWNKLSPMPDLVETIIKAIESQKTWDQWTKDGGTYIPYPVTWLNSRRWEDDFTPPKALPKPGHPDYYLTH